MKIYLRLATSVFFILLAFTAGCTNHQRARKEEALREDLYTMRSAIDQYAQDQGHGPQHLSDLVARGYLRAIPQDPFTGTADSWIEEQEDVTDSVDRTRPGISDVHSGSHLQSSEGTRYDSW